MITSQFNLGNMKQLFGSISPQNQLDGIVGGASGKFLNALGINSGGLGGVLGGGGSGGGFGGFF